MPLRTNLLFRFGRFVHLFYSSDVAVCDNGSLTLSYGPRSCSLKGRKRLTLVHVTEQLHEARDLFDDFEVPEIQSQQSGRVSATPVAETVACWATASYRGGYRGLLVLYALTATELSTFRTDATDIERLSIAIQGGLVARETGDRTAASCAPDGDPSAKAIDDLDSARSAATAAAGTGAPMPDLARIKDKTVVSWHAYQTFEHYWRTGKRDHRANRLRFYWTRRPLTFFREQRSLRQSPAATQQQRGVNLRR